MSLFFIILLDIFMSWKRATVAIIELSVRIGSFRTFSNMNLHNVERNSIHEISLTRVSLVFVISGSKCPRLKSLVSSTSRKLQTERKRRECVSKWEWMDLPPVYASKIFDTWFAHATSVRLTLESSRQKDRNEGEQEDSSIAVPEVRDIDETSLRKNT